MLYFCFLWFLDICCMRHFLWFIGTFWDLLSALSPLGSLQNTSLSPFSSTGSDLNYILRGLSFSLYPLLPLSLFLTHFFSLYKQI